MFLYVTAWLERLKLKVSHRYAFLLDKALLICKRKGDSYEMKTLVLLSNYQVREDASAEKDNKKVILGCVFEGKDEKGM